MSDITATVVIPTYRRAESLRCCLAALALQTRAPLEVIVVSDASPDHTREVVSQAPAPLRVRFIEFRQNRGPSAARNAGIAAATAEVIAFTDDDCEPEPGWLEALASAVMGKGNGGAGGAVVSGEDHLIARYAVRHRVLEPPESVAYLVTCNCAYRRDVLMEVGGFDETIRRPGGEDPELSARVRKAGYRLGYDPRAIVKHHFRPGLREFARTFFTYGRGGRPAAVEGTLPVPLREIPWELAMSLYSYGRDGVPAAERARLLALRAVHLLSYRAGWALGSRPAAAAAPARRAWLTEAERRQFNARGDVAFYDFIQWTSILETNLRAARGADANPCQEQP